MMEAVNTDSKGKINYLQLRQIIFDYFKETQALDLWSISVDYWRNKLAHDAEPRPFFIIHEEYGETRFDISKENIQQIFEIYLAKQDFELTSDLEYGDSDTITFSYRKNPFIRKEMEQPQNQVELNLDYDGHMDISQLQGIVSDYFKEINPTEVISYSVRKADSGNGDYCYFVKYDNSGVGGQTRISEDEIRNILSLYLNKNGYELVEFKITDKVDFKYKKSKAVVQKDEVDRSGELMIDNPTSHMLSVDEYGRGETSFETMIPNIMSSRDEKPRETTVPDDMPSPDEKPRETTIPSEPSMEKPETTRTLVVSDESLEKMAREKRKFTILQRKRALTDAEKGKNRSALVAGLCILGSAVAIYFNHNISHEVIQHELSSIYSWDALVQYLKDLGPLTTLLTASAAAAVCKYFKFSKKYKNIQNEFEDFNASLENENIEELGGKKNVSSR